MILLLKHGGPSKWAAIQAAQKLGPVLVVDSDGNVPLENVPYLQVRSMNVMAILDALDRAAVRATACLTYVDPFTPIAADLAKRLGVFGLSPEAAKMLKDKIRVRERLRSSGVRKPRFHTVASRDDIEQAVQIVGFPSVIKPAGGAYGVGVRLVSSADALSSEL